MKVGRLIASGQASRRLAWAWWLALTCMGVGCSAENGKGVVMGSLNVPACTFPDKKPTPLANEDSFGGHWNYFLGEPFDSTTPKFPANQINIRMQSISGGWEFADALFFWVLDSYEVARCTRGRMNADGTPDWNTEVCLRDPGATAGRMRIGTEDELVTAHLVLYDSCPIAELAAVALGTCAGGSCPPTSVCPGRGSWISFSRFGAATSADSSGQLSTDFKVNKDEPIEASAFHVELCDQATVDGVMSNEVPLPKVSIMGTLDGSFSFHLQPNFR